LTVHHIAADGWSRGVLTREVAALYAAAVEGRPAQLPELSVQYADYARWQREWLTGEVLERQLGYWRHQLAGVPLVLDLPTDRPRPAVQSFGGAVLPFALPAPLAAALKGLGQAAGATQFMVLLAAFDALLHRYSGQEVVLVGSPIAGRTRRELEPLIGLFVNTLVLRAGLAGSPSFADLLAQVRETTLGAFAHQELPFERLVEELQPARDLSRPPLVQVLFGFQNAPLDRLDLPGLKSAPYGLRTQTAKFDLSLSLAESADAIVGAFEYNTGLFDRSRIGRLAAQMEQLLTAASAELGRPLSELSLLSPAERQQLLAEWNDAATARPRELGLHQLFESQVERSPEALAVLSEAAGLTYRELDLASNRLARWLVASGVGPEAIVGVLFERSLEMVVALLGVLKAGGAYLPLDPSTPQERLGFFLADAAPRLVLTTSALAALVPPGVRAVSLDTEWEAIGSASSERLEVPLAPDALAYVIYTSGSTGQPKGVMNAHRGAVNRILWIEEAYGLAAGARLLQKTPLSFDVSVGEIFWPLATGACLVMARPGGHRDPDYLVEVLAREEITNVHFVPSMLRVFLEAPGVERCAALARVLASGEALPGEVAARLFERLGRVELHNLYGPTEAAVEVSAWTCRREEARMGVPIGRPIA
ncbi:MAG TPA: condensation domain-containing protein, partial [Thermoanaerobaculia bacterium]|nr:condensation domain-containing protein [Thermoanaerobaculia bacterium]